MNHEDKERQAFLERLAGSRCPLTEWEADFVENLLVSQELETNGNFSMRQRNNIDQMRKRYEKEL